MTKWAMVIDINKCIACYACYLACKDEFWNNDYLPYSLGIKKREQTLIRLMKRERGKFPYVKVSYMPILCMHCDEPPCMKAAKNNAVYKREDGIVIIDPARAVGQKEIVDACPYGLVSWNDEKNIPQKCTFCIHRIKNGKIPRCVQACPSGALIFGDLDDQKSEVNKMVKSELAEQFHPEYGTKPNIYYVGLYKMTKNFIAGTVIFEDSGECADGVNITIINATTNISIETRTNNFGDFIVDGLEHGNYKVKIELPGYTTKLISVELKGDTYLGVIPLTKITCYSDNAKKYNRQEL